MFEKKNSREERLLAKKDNESFSYNPNLDDQKDYNFQDEIEKLERELRQYSHQGSTDQLMKVKVETIDN